MQRYGSGLPVEDLLMTHRRDFKRLVRARMEQTGESYSTARMHLLRRRRGTSARTDPTLSSHRAPRVRATLTADELVAWFFERYKHPANGVPYESRDGGYLY